MLFPTLSSLRYVKAHNPYFFLVVIVGALTTNMQNPHPMKVEQLQQCVSNFK
jgi:hypothetical protein